MSDKIKKIQEQIKVFRRELEKIGNYYNQDGTIDPSEQQHLDAMMATIAQCEQKLNDLIFDKSKSRLPKNSVSNSKDKNPELLYEKFGGSSYTVKKGDYLQKIAKGIYGNRLFWPLIRDANKDKVKKNGNFVLVGAVLEIPEIQIAVATSGQNQSVDNQVNSIPAVPKEDNTGGITPAVEDEQKEVRYMKFTSPDGKVHMMTEPEFEEFKKGIIKNFEKTHLFAMKSKASSAKILWEHFKRMNDDQYIVAWFVSFSAGDLPSYSIIKKAEKAVKAVSSAVSSGDLSKIASTTRVAEKAVNHAIQTMDTYRTKIIDGAGKWISRLETTATASFAIVVVAGGAVLTPVIGATSAAVVMGGGTSLIRSTASEISASYNGVNDDAFISDIVKSTLTGMATGAINAQVMSKLVGPLVKSLTPKILGTVLKETGGKYTVETLTPYVENVLKGSANRLFATSIKTVLKLVTNQGKNITFDKFINELSITVKAGGVAGLLIAILPPS